MLSRLSHALTLASLTFALAAQYQGEPPTKVVQAAAKPSLGAAGVGNGVTGTAQVQLVPHWSLAPGVSYACLTVYKSGSTNTDVMTGTFDAATETFVKNGDVDAFNTTGNEFAATVSDDLLVFACDTAAGARYATRATPSGPFGALAPIGGVPAGYIDTCFARIGGKVTLLYIQGVDIWAGDFAAGAVTNARKIVSNVPGSAGLHSPSPMDDSAGVTRSLLFSTNAGSGNADALFTAALDDSAKKSVLHDTATWLANPDSNGGSLVYAEATTSYGNPTSFGIVAMADASVPSYGGTLDLVAFGPTRKPAEAGYLGTIALGFLAPAGIPMPAPFVGKLGLDPASMVLLPTAPFDKVSGTLEYSFVVPPIPAGLSIHAQPVLIDLMSGGFWLGNTARIGIVKVDRARSYDVTFGVDATQLANHAVNVLSAPKPYTPAHVAENRAQVGATTAVTALLRYQASSGSTTLSTSLVVDNVTRVITKLGVPVTNLAQIWTLGAPPVLAAAEAEFLADTPLETALAGGAVVKLEGQIRTKKKNLVPVYPDGGRDTPTAAEEKAGFTFCFEGDALKAGNLIATATADYVRSKSFNCHSYAYIGASNAKKGWVDDPDVPTLLADNYKPIAEKDVKNGDIVVVWNKVAKTTIHSEIVTDFDGTAKKVKSSKSKHGVCGIFDRKPSDTALNVYFDKIVTGKTATGYSSDATELLFYTKLADLEFPAK